MQLLNAPSLLSTLFFLPFFIIFPNQPTNRPIHPSTQPIITREIFAENFTSYLLPLAPKHSPKSPTKLKHTLFHPFFFPRCPCNPSRSRNVPRVFPAPFIKRRPFSTALFIISHREEVEASTRTNANRTLFVVTFPYLFNSIFSLSPLSHPPFASFLQFRSVTPLRDPNRRRRRRKKKEEEVFRTRARRLVPLLHFPVHEISSLERNEECIIAIGSSVVARGAFRPSELTPLLFFCDE